VDEEGRIVFHGRVDDQVKVRGYRVELGEIEAELSRLPDVKTAAVALRKDGAGSDQLVAFFVLREGAKLDHRMMRTALAARIPSYMVPSLFTPLEELPRLPSGKLNRKALPAVSERAAESDERELVAPRTPTETRLRAVWEALFPGRRVSVTDDFFTDLGGHSLIVATYVSQLRKDAALRTVSLQDVYATRTISSLAERIDAASTVRHTERRAFVAVPRLRYFVCSVAQTVALLFSYGLGTAFLLFPFLTYSFVLADTSSHAAAALATIASFTAIPPLALLVSIAAKWLVLGRYKAGEYPLWGWYYFRWWFAGKLTFPAWYLSNTPI
jgi:hypothetical protein